MTDLEGKLTVIADETSIERRFAAGFWTKGNRRNSEVSDQPWSIKLRLWINLGW
jgi:hypothetical protein